jgi:hypothetical protein
VWSINSCMNVRTLGVLSGLLFTACAVDPMVAGESETAEPQAETTSIHGTSVNGTSVNGVSINGVSVNGVSINGVSINGVSVNGVSVNGVSINGTTLTGTDANGQPVTTSSVGATLTATLSTGATLELRIDSAATLAAPNSDVWSYGVSYAAADGWLPLCGDPAIRALQIMGSWESDGSFTASTTSFTFACRGASVAKCVELGYNPARGYTSHMVSCVRLLRGDYCGTGLPYTVTGNPVNIYDSLAIQRDTQTDWMTEAEWTPSGATCISLARFTRFEEHGLVPACVASGELEATLGCGARGFRSGSLMISEIAKSMPETTTTTSSPTTKTNSLKD